MNGPHLVRGHLAITTDRTLRRDLEHSAQAAFHANIEARLCLVEQKLERLMVMLHELTDTLMAQATEED